MTEQLPDTPPPVANGTRCTLEGKPCVFYDGYWIRDYPPPVDSPAARGRLIQHLSRRLFHHTEPGINTPGASLDAARAAYDRESDPARKRVNGAMLAGALFNRASDIFRSVVDLQERGVEISPDNELMRQCGEHFEEALELGRMVKHYSGEEGIDELWGEPFKAFTMPIEDFYESRYIKIAQAMRDIDTLSAKMVVAFREEPGFGPAVEHIVEFSEAAKLVSETIRRDPVIFQIWPRFTAAGEALLAFRPSLPEGAPEAVRERAAAGRRLLKDGKALLTYISGARTRMPKSTQDYLARCDRFLAGRSG
jgi:hypothetical protein